MAAILKVVFLSNDIFDLIYNFDNVESNKAVITDIRFFSINFNIMFFFKK